MSGYQDRVNDCKSAVTKQICQIAAGHGDIMDLASYIDNLNKAWDELTDCLVRQRDTRDAQIFRLMNELAEAKK